MSNTVRSGKQNRHEKITVTLLSGKPVSPDEIKSCFKGTDQEAVLYRLSTTNTYASSKVANLGCAMKVTWWDSSDAPSTDLISIL